MDRLTATELEILAMICGGSSYAEIAQRRFRAVATIKNQATANLYNYTPYQPNRQTLAQPSGPGGDCSTYGNLNFSRIYDRWFGDPHAVRYSGLIPPCLVYTDGFGCPPVNPFAP